MEKPLPLFKTRNQENMERVRNNSRRSFFGGVGLSLLDPLPSS